MPKRRCAAAARPKSRSASGTQPSTAAGRCPASRTPAHPTIRRGKFVWWRARMLGGRTNHWGRISLRNGPYDFKPHTRDGLGFDWPMSYEDLAPYYDKVEMLIGVYGANDGLENTPNSPPGVLLPPPEAARQRPAHPAARRESSAFPSIAGHRAVLTQRARPRAPAEAAASRQREGAEDPRAPTCRSAPPASSPRPAAAAARSGLTTSRPPCTCRRRWTPATSTSSPTPWCAPSPSAPTARAEGVIFIDRKTGAEHRVKARVVVLAASALESVRILLNSGVANSAAARSANTSWTPWARTSAARCRCSRTCRCTTKTASTACTCTRRGGCTRSSSPGKLGFARGYHIEFGGGRTMPGMGTAVGPRVAQRRQLRQEVQGRRAPLLRLVRGLRRPRRDDPERRLLRRARSRR